MLSTNLKTIKLAGLTLLIICSAIGWGCNRPGSAGGKKELISFKALNGIYYTEVARRQNNGLSFNEYGAELEPQWKIKFVSDDSLSVYSPKKKQFINFFLTRGYDSIFNAARAWLKVKKMNKDSMVLEVLKSRGDSVYIKGTKVYMLLYADNYVKNVLHTDTETQRHPSRKDTLFIRSLVTRANADYTRAFAARQPAVLTSRSPQVKISRRTTTPDLFNNFETSDDYLDPTFDIVINKAYKDFYYSFTVYVDDKGQMHYGIPLVSFIDDDFKGTYIRISKGIMESYLKLYLNIQPGSTLGMLHTSKISVNVRGLTAPAR